jgi:hypothetical protein
MKKTKDMAKKVGRDVAITSLHITGQKVAKKGIFIVLKSAATKTIWISSKVVKKVGPALYVASKIYDGAKYLYENKDRIKEEGVVETVKEDFKEHPVEMAIKTIL